MIQSFEIGHLSCCNDLIVSTERSLNEVSHKFLKQGSEAFYLVDRLDQFIGTISAKEIFEFFSMENEEIKLQDLLENESLVADKNTYFGQETRPEEFYKIIKNHFMAPVLDSKKHVLGHLTIFDFDDFYPSSQNFSKMKIAHENEKDLFIKKFLDQFEKRVNHLLDLNSLEPEVKIQSVVDLVKKLTKMKGFKIFHRDHRNDTYNVLFGDEKNEDAYLDLDLISNLVNEKKIILNNKIPYQDKGVITGEQALIIPSIKGGEVEIIYVLSGKINEQKIDYYDYKILESCLLPIEKFIDSYLLRERYLKLEGSYQKSIVENLSSNQKLKKEMKTYMNLALIGETSGSIAHDLKTPLTVAICELENVSNFHENLDLPDKIIRSTGRINDSLVRIENIIESFSAMIRSNSSTEKMSFFSIRDSVESCFLMFEDKLKKYEVSFIQNVSKDLKIRGHKIQIEQVFSNIISNAIDAMVVSDEKIITLKARELRGEEIEIVIEDTGPGIPDFIKDKVFGRFYTTKSSGQGTGLGLYISKNIIEQHGGSIRFERKGNISRFIIIFNKNK